MKQNLDQLPLVSVLIITYNQECFIEEALDSVLAQDYPNFEIVIADDASSDKTTDILKRYQTNYPNKIKLILGKENLGITGNFQRARKECKGDFITFLGGDDLMLPGKLKYQVEFMKSDPSCVLCYHDTEVFDSVTGNHICNYSSKHTPFEGRASVVVRHGCFFSSCSAMERALHKKHHHLYLKIRWASDWLYWIETLEKGGRICYLNKVLSKYRRHPNNTTSLHNFNVIMDHFYTAIILLIYRPKYLPDLIIRIGQGVFRVVLNSYKWK